MKKIFLLTVIAFLAISAFSQKKNIEERSIELTLTPLKNTKVYLASYFGKSTIILSDSVILDNESRGIFKGPKLTQGIYFAFSPPSTIWFELLLDEGQNFSMVGDTLHKGESTITGSQENVYFKEYNNFSAATGQKINEQIKNFKEAKTKADSTKARIEFEEANKQLDAYRDTFVEKHPESLLSLLFNGLKSQKAPPIPIVKGKADSSYPYRFLKEHYWDNIYFNDDRLLHTPFFEPKLEDYFKYYVSAEPDSIIGEIKYMLLSSRNAKEMYPYLLTKFTNKYMTPEIMGQDKVFIYLFENFYAKGDTTLLSDKSKKSIIERAYSLMANQIGLPAPQLKLLDTANKPFSLYNLSSKFFFIAFWDPTCGHCKTEIPKLDSLFQNSWIKKKVTMVGVNINYKEFPAWKDFIRKNHLKGWIHGYQTEQMINEEVRKNLPPTIRQLYDVTQTPTFYLLDADKKIIAKQLSFEQFEKIIDLKSMKSK